MAKKFHKNRSVQFAYHAVPIYYTGIIHPNNKDRELVLVDDYGQHFMAAWRNNKLCRVGRHFVLKKEIQNKKVGFVHKDKFIALRKRGGWVL